MKKLAMAALVALGLTLVGNSAQAADQVSSATLSQCGLSGMQSLSDEQGLQIRAKGTLIIQANVLIVYAPSVNIQQNAIDGCNKALIIVKASKIGKGPR